MAKKRRRKSRDASEPKEAGAKASRERERKPADDRAKRSRALWPLLGVAGLALVVAVVLLQRNARRSTPSSIPLPPPSESPAVDSVALSDFVGVDQCAECHQRQVAAWRGSTHAAAGGAPSQTRIVAAFNGPPIRFRDAIVSPSASDGRFAFVVRRAGRPDQTITVDAVVGGGHMEGGGTQGFLTRWADGTYRFLPFDYSRQGGFWFCNTIGRGDRAWIPITDSLPLAACADWPPTRALGDEPRFNNCQSCHGSQISVSLDTAAHSYRTSFSTLAIGCESCHGPARRHLALVRDSAALAAGDLGMAPLASLDKDASLGTCWSCHTLKDRLRSGYVSGKPVASYYSIRLPQLGDAARFADGRVRTFAYQEGHLYSDCYVNGGMTCTSCHDPHSQRYRDVTGRPLPGRFDDGQCTACHASKADAARAHTHHRAGSPGSACTSCHMPYLQEPEVGTAVRYARSDHAIPIPRPAFDSTLGITSACRGCHTDRAVSALDAQVKDWYGTLKPQARGVDALFRARDVANRAEAARLVLVPDERHTASLFAGMAYFLDRFLGPDMGDLERDVEERLEALAGHPDQDVRALALASLHFARGTDAVVRRFLADALRSAGAGEDALRARWAISLGYLADRLRAAGNAAAAIATYQKAIEIQPRNAATAVNLALAYGDAGNLAAAVEQYERSLSIDPLQPLTLVNLGIARAGQRNVAGAIETYRRALRLNEREPLAHFNLGGVFLQQQNADSAAIHLSRAAELDPSLALARFYLARILAARGDLRAALREIEGGLEFDPNNAEAQALRTELRRRL